MLIWIFKRWFLWFAAPVIVIPLIVWAVAHAFYKDALTERLFESVKAGQPVRAICCAALGADCNYEKDGCRTLLVAYRQHDARMVRILLFFGADPTSISQLPGKGPWCTLAEAIGDGDYGMFLRMLPSARDLHVKDAYGGTLLGHSINCVRYPMSRELVKAGADVNEKFYRLETPPLALAVSAVGSDLYRFLIERGANVNATDNQGTTILMYATRGGTANIVMALLKAGANISPTNTQGRTALSYARPTTRPILEEWIRMHPPGVQKTGKGL
jgi:hypothetical protein